MSDIKLELYEIPIFCINLPEEFITEEDNEQEETIDNTIPKTNFTFRSISFPDHKLDIVLSDDIKNMKMILSKKIEKKREDIRIFYQGKELKEGSKISTFKLNPEIVLIYAVSS